MNTSRPVTVNMYYLAMAPKRSIHRRSQILTLGAALVGVARAVAFFVPAEDGELVVTIVGSADIWSVRADARCGRADVMVSGVRYDR